jgi:putative serine/threonine protein kinase
LQGSETASLEQLHDEKYARVLCYPRYNSIEAKKRIRELKRLGVKAIEFSGEKQAFNVPILGKGCVGLVVITHTKTGRAALKIRRVDADRKGMEREAEMLKKANSIGIGPRFIGFDENFLLMEFEEGLLLPKWVANLKGRGTKKRIRLVLRDILEQCWKLDRAGLDHGELSRAPKHVIIDAEDKAHIVDFETASTMRRVSNVTSICQFLFLGSQLAKTLKRKLGEIENEALTGALRTYKLNGTKQNFLRILHVCRLTS